MKIDMFCHILPIKYKEAFYKITPDNFYLKNVIDSLQTLYDLEHRFRIKDKYEDLRHVPTLGLPPIEAIAEGEKAIELYTRSLRKGEKFDVVILDLTVIGGMGGEKTIRRLLEIDPHVKAIVSSGYSNDPIMAEYEKHGFVGVVLKPYNARELHSMLKKIIKSGRN